MATVVHVEDICRAFAAVLTAPRGAVHNEAFNVGRTAENYRVSELAEMVRQAVPGCVIEYAAGGGPDRRCYRVDCNKFPRQVPQFQPKWSVRRGVAQLIDAYRRVPLSRNDIVNQRFLRLPTLERHLTTQALDSFTAPDNSKRGGETVHACGPIRL